MIRYFHPACVPRSNAPFSQVVIDNNYAHLAGLVAADFPDGQAVLGDVAKETDAVLIVVRKILEELGLTLQDIVRVDLHLASLEDFTAMDAAYRSHFADERFPARTTTESPRLFGQSKVEITCQVQLAKR